MPGELTLSSCPPRAKRICSEHAEASTTTAEKETRSETTYFQQINGRWYVRDLNSEKTIKRG